MIDINAIKRYHNKKLEENLSRRRFIQKKYNDSFKDMDEIDIPPIYSETCQYYCLVQS